MVKGSYHVGSDGATQLEDIRVRFQEWRRTARPGKSIIPCELWQAAASLARFYSLSRIAKELSLDYVKLKTFVPEAWRCRPVPEKAVSPTVAAATRAVSATSVEQAPRKMVRRNRPAVSSLPLGRSPALNPGMRSTAIGEEFLEVSLQPYLAPPRLVAELVISGEQVLKLYSGNPEELLKIALQR